MTDFNPQEDWSSYMIQVDHKLIEASNLMNDRSFEEADALIVETINLLSKTRGWILHNRRS